MSAEIQKTFPENGRTIRIKATAVTERMGIAGWEGYRQGDVAPYCWWFVHSGTRLGDPKIGMPWDIPWWYVEEDSTRPNKLG